MTIQQSLQQTLATVIPSDQVQPIDFVTPGFRGLNTVQAGSLMDPGYCVVAQNAVIDTSQRLAARQGANPITFESATLLWTAAPTGTSATLAIAWAQPSGVYIVTFSDKEARAVTFTNTATTATWTGALTGTSTTAFSVTGGANEQITFTAPPTGTSGTLTAPWNQATGTYLIYFSDGEQRSAVFTNGSTGVNWTQVLSGTPQVTASILFSIQGIIEYNQGAGVYQQVFSWAGGISNTPQHPTNNLGGAVNVTNGRWFFQNFNNKCIGFQAGQKPIVYTGTGTFATVVESAGTAPTGGVGCAAFGRIWSVQSDLQTINYSGLLDETDWSLTDGNAGLIDMHTIWSDGTDQVTAIFAFNASLVVCGTKHIIFFTDGRGSMLGMDPTQAYVFDMLAGTGCISQWTVDHVGEADVLLLSPNGIQSLLRLTQNRNNPVETLSKYNRDTLLSQIQSEIPANISGCFNNLTGFYILALPSTGVTWCFDQRLKYIDAVGEQCSITTTWSMAITACCSFVANQQLFICRANQGTVCNYSGFSDEGSTYQWAYQSPWMNLGQNVAQRLKMLKRLTLILFTAGGASFTATWAVDFSPLQGQAAQTVQAFGTNSQYGIGQYGLAQYGGGSNLYNWKYAAHIRGQYFQIGLTTIVSGVFAVQQAQLAAKIGRIA
jgi:hypothetical protein